VTTATPIETILFATDFSTCAAQAYEYALRMASISKATVHILHVLEFQPGMDPEFPVNRLYLDQLRKETGEQFAALEQQARRLNLRIMEHQKMGIPSREIVEAARQFDVNLIVLGTHGRTGIEHVLLGSTAERVIKSAPCPVLAVRDSGVPPARTTDKDAPAIAIERILAPIDFSDCSLDALEYAAQTARQFKAKVTIVHVMEPVAYGLDFTLAQPRGQDRQERLSARLSELASALKGCGLEADYALRGGLPAETILNAERAGASDLIVMGTHGRRGFSHFVSGSVAEAVLRRARCPVLAVRSPKFGSGHRRLVSLGGGKETNVS